MNICLVSTGWLIKVQHKGFLCRDNYKRTGLKCSLSLAHFHQSILMEICWSQPENHGLYIKQCKIFLTLPTRAIAGFMSLRWHLSCHQGPAQSLAMLLRHRRSSNGDRWPFSRVLPCWHQELLPQKDSLPSSYMTNGTAFSYGHLRLGTRFFAPTPPGFIKKVIVCSNSAIHHQEKCLLIPYSFPLFFTHFHRSAKKSLQPSAPLTSFTHVSTLIYFLRSSAILPSFTHHAN